MTGLNGYLVSADLGDDAPGHDDLVHRLADYDATVSVQADGGAAVHLHVSGPDMWQAVLAAMVGLTDAYCEPAALHVTATGPRPAEHHRCPRPWTPSRP